MEITNNQIKIQALESTAPTKASVVEVDENNARLAEKAVVSEESNNDSSKQAEKLHVAVGQINDYVQNLQRNLQFTVDEATGKDVVTVIDSESKEVIRQLPSEEALELARRLVENKENGVQLVSIQV